MKRWLAGCTAFFAGGALYGLCELAFRGWTHWTMPLLGGLCARALYAISGLRLRLRTRCLLGCAAITAAEYLAGCLLNRRLGLGIWDYSAHFGSVRGQICPLFSLIWLGLTLPAFGLCALIRRAFHDTAAGGR